MKFKDWAYESRYLLFKRQNDKLWVKAPLPLSASHLLFSVKFLLDRSDCAKTVGKYIMNFFLSVLAPMTGHWVYIKMLYLANERLLCMSAIFEVSILYPNTTFTNVLLFGTKRK